MCDDELIAYIVYAGIWNSEQLSTDLQAKLPNYLLPNHYVPVSCIPLTEIGQVDEIALKSIEIIDNYLIEYTEKELKCLPEIDQAAVLITPQTNNILPLHLSDILPQKETKEINEKTKIVENKSNQQDNFYPSKLAISHGKSLLKSVSNPKILGEVLQKQARENQQKGIIYIKSNGQEIFQSYQQLWDEAQRIHTGLKNSGLTVQDKVIFQLSETSDIIAAFWGCILCGVIPVILAVPPSYENISNDINKICQVWELLEHPLIITNEFCKSEVKTLEKWLSNQTLNIKLIEELKAYSPQEYYYINQPEDIAFFSLTSGSTGMSKCIPLTHKNLLSRGRGTNELCGYSKDDIILNWLPFDHIGSISEFHIRCVDLGCDMVYVETDYILSRPLNWLDLINQYRITNSWSPNFAYTLINEALKKEPSQNWNLSCVKFVLTAGEAVSDTTVEEFINKLHNQYKFKKTAVRPAFGMAEMGSGITYYQGTEEHPLLFHTIDKFSLNQTLKRVHPEHPNGTTFTDLGLPISGISIRIVNQDNVLLPEDTIGHLQVKGDAVSPGYYKNPEANKKAFLKDGWFDTGDLGFIKDGHLIITGRSKETIIINGVNYYSHEIETVVDTIEVVEASYTAACAVKEDNSQTDKLALFFSTQLVTSEELKNLLKKIRQKVINNFGINPDYLIPLNKKEIPKTSIGKTQRSQLIERFRQGEFKDIIKEIDILLENNQTIPDWFYRKVWQEKKIFHLKQNLPNGHTLIFLDQLGLGEFLAKQLQEKNLPYITILAGKNYTQLNSNSYTINPTESDHYLSLITSLAQQNHPISNIIHLWTYQTYQGEIDCSEQLEKAQEEGIYSLLFIVQALAKNQYFAKQYIDEKIQLLFISSDSQWVDNHEKIAYEKSPVLGLNKTISQEFSWINSRHIDLPVDGITLNSKLILEELLTLSKEKEIAYRQGKRLVKGLEKVEFSQKNAQKIPFEQGGIYLITGGLGGIGIEISQYLLKNYNARLLLLGTTILPDKKDWNEFIKKEDKYSQKIKHLQTLEKLGGEVIYKAVDIGNLTQLEKAVNEAQNKWQSKLNGVIHLAGIYQEKLIIEQTKQNLSELLRPKVLGTWNLHQLMKKERVMFISFSSLASFFGGATLSGYTAANRFLEHLNDYQQATNVYPSYCYSWTSWQETGMSQGKYTVRSQGYYSVTVQQGLNSFLASLYHHHKQLMIGLDGNKPKIKPYISLFERLEKLTAYYSLKPSSNALKLPSKLYLKDRFATSYSCQLFLKKSFPLNSYGRIDKDILLQEITGKNDKEWIIPRNDTETKIAQIWQEILNIQKISIHDNFFELGGHSLLASQVISRLHNTFSVHLSLKNLLDYPTIANLGQIIEVLKMTQNAKILLRKTEKDYEEGEL